MHPYPVTRIFKQVGLAAWLECWIFYLGVAGLNPSHDNLSKPLGEYVAPITLRMIDDTKTGKSL